MEDIHGRPTSSGFYSPAGGYTLDGTYPVQERGGYTFTEATYAGRYCIAKSFHPGQRWGDDRLKRAWLVHKILSVPCQCLDVKTPFQAPKSFSRAEAEAEMEQMRLLPGHKAILGVLGIDEGQQPYRLLLDNFQYTLADHLVNPISDLRLSETTGFNCDAWFKVLENSYAGLQYVHYVGEMQLVAVSPSDLVHSHQGGGQWMWSDFSRVHSFIPSNNLDPSDRENARQMGIQKMDADFAHFAQQLFLALPWEYTRHAMPELLDAYTPENKVSDQWQLMRALKLLYSMAHSFHADNTAYDGGNIANASLLYSTLMESRNKVSYYFENDVVRDKRLRKLPSWKNILRDTLVQCHFPALPAPDKKTHLMQLAGFAKPAVFE